MSLDPGNISLPSPMTTGNNDDLGPDSKLPLIKTKLQAILNANPSLRLFADVNKDGKEFISLQGEMDKDEFPALQQKLKEINDIDGIEIAATFIETVEVDKVASSDPDAPIGQQGDLPQPKVSINIAFAREEVMKRSGAGNPWLKPNGLLALQMALIELSMVQTKIKTTSSQFWRDNLNNVLALAKDTAGLVKASADLEAQRNRIEADASTKQGYLQLTTGLIQAGTLGVSIGASTVSSRMGRTAEKKLEKDTATQGSIAQRRNVLQQKMQNKENELMAERNRAPAGTDGKITVAQSKNPQTSQTTRSLNITRRDTPGQTRDEKLVASDQAKTSETKNNASVAMNKQDARATNANNQVKTGQRSKEDIDRDIKQNRDNYNNNPVHKDMADAKAAIQQQYGQKAHAIQMNAQQFGQIVGQLSSATSELYIQVQKFTQLGDTALQKGVIDSATEMARAFSSITNKALDQAERDRKDASDILSSALQTLVSLVEKAYRINIDIHGRG